jgi:hypothetical protein
MNTIKSRLTALDAEIDRLKQARALLDCNASTPTRASPVTSKHRVRLTPLRKEMSAKGRAGRGVRTATRPNATR